MPVAVVRELEVVQVDERERQRFLAARRDCNCARKLVLERAMIAEIRQRIAGGAFDDQAVPAGEDLPPSA